MKRKDLIKKFKEISKLIDKQKISTNDRMVYWNGKVIKCKT